MKAKVTGMTTWQGTPTSGTLRIYPEGRYEDGQGNATPGRWDFALNIADKKWVDERNTAADAYIVVAGIGDTGPAIEAVFEEIFDYPGHVRVSKIYRRMLIASDLDATQYNYTEPNARTYTGREPLTMLAARELLIRGEALNNQTSDALASASGAAEAAAQEISASRESRQATAAAFAYAGEAFTVVAQYDGAAEAFGGGPFSGFGWGLPRPSGPLSRVAVQVRDTDAAHRCTTLRWRIREGSHQGAVLRSGTVAVGLSLTEYREVLLTLASPLTPTGVLFVEVAANGGRLSLRRRPDGQALPNMPQVYAITDGNPDTNPDGGDLWGGLPNPYTMATRLDIAGDGTLVRLSSAMQTAVVEAAVPTPVLAMPPVIYAVVGVEQSVWFETAYQWPLDSLSAYTVVTDGYCLPSEQRPDRRWTMTPAPGDVGEHQVTFRVYDNRKTLVREDVLTVRVAAVGAGGGATRKMLLIGDSHARRGWWTGALQQRMDAAGGLTFQQVGPYQTENPPLTYNAGRPGWTIQSFCLDAASPFYNADLATASGNGFDFSKYLSTSGVNLEANDAVAIALGTNSFEDPLFLSAGASSLIERERVMLREMIRRIRLACNARIAVMTIKPVGYARRYGHFENLPQLYSRMLMDVAGGRESERIYVVPHGVALDRLSGFEYAQVAASARTPDVLERHCIDPIHPRVQGYQQLADSDFAFWKWLA